MDEDCAGSCPNLESTIGMLAPTIPAIPIEIAIDSAITRISPEEPLHKYDLQRRQPLSDCERGLRQRLLVRESLIGLVNGATVATTMAKW